MRSLLSSFKELLFYGADQKKPAHYKAWSERLRQVTLSRLLPLFCNLKDSIEDSLRRDYMDQVCDILKGLDDSSSLDCEYSPEAGETAIVQAKQSLLELWHHLLDCIEKVPVSEVNPIIFSVILWIMKRPEFDLTHLRWDAAHTPTCEHHVLIMAYRYRKLLLSTLSYVVRNLNSFAEAYVRANSPRPIADDPAAAGGPSSSPSSSVAGCGGGAETLASQGEDVAPFKSGSKNGGLDKQKNSDVFGEQKNNESEQKEKNAFGGNGDKPFGDAKPEGVISVGENDMINSASAAIEEGRRSDDDGGSGGEMKKTNGAEDEDINASVPKEGNAREEDECGPIFKYTPKIPVSPPPQRSKSRKKIVPIQSQNTNTLYGTLPQPFAVFSAKTLAFLFFRFPAIQDTIIRAALSNLDDHDPEDYGMKRPDAAYPPEKCPILFQWDVFHESVKKWNNDTKVDTINHLPKTWLLFISTRVEFFVEFYVEWICCACNKLVTEDPSEWLSVPGYVDLTLAYFSLYGLPPGAPRPPPRYFFSCENLMLNTDVPLVLENVVRFHFLRTRVSDTAQVNECLSFFESWLITLARAKARVGNRFDPSVLSAGIDGLLATDHHLILSKVLALLYNYGWVFHDEPRLALFGDVLLDKHFYHLFLHWDENVRNLFMQVLLFRLLTCKRRDIVSAEIAMAAAAQSDLLPITPPSSSSSSSSSSGPSTSPASTTTTAAAAGSSSSSGAAAASNPAVSPKEGSGKGKGNGSSNGSGNGSGNPGGAGEEARKVKPEQADFVLIHKADGFIWAVGECAKQMMSANGGANGGLMGVRGHKKSTLRRQSLDRKQQQVQQEDAGRFTKGKKVYITEEAPEPIVTSEREARLRKMTEEEEEEEEERDNDEFQRKSGPREGNVVVLKSEDDDDDEEEEEEEEEKEKKKGGEEMGKDKGEEVNGGMTSKYSFTAPGVPEGLKVYIDRSLREFKKHLTRYEDWEAKAKEEPPKLLLYPTY